MKTQKTTPAAIYKEMLSDADTELVGILADDYFYDGYDIIDTMVMMSYTKAEIDRIKKRLEVK